MSKNEEYLDLDETMEHVLSYCLDEAQNKKIELGSFDPFTVIVEGENMHIETYPDEDPEIARANAEAQIRTASSFATHYALCYDGYVEAEEEETGKEADLDGIIVECAQRDMDEAMAIVLIYDEDGDRIEFSEEAGYAGPAEFLFVKDAVKAAEEDEFARAQAKIKKVGSSK